jgi:hypothetical protein
VSLNQLHKKYQDQVEFIHVYLSEAHPTDGWDLAPTAISQLIHRYTEAKPTFGVRQHTSFDERNKMASRCKMNLLGDMPVYVDKMDNRAQKIYNSFPTRIYLIGKDGRIAYNPGPGPWSFNPAYLGPEIEKYLASS